MSRTLTAGTIYSKKYKTIKFKGIWKDVLGEPEATGIWLLFGAEKNGKTWGALLLADELSKVHGKVLYVSAEEGTGMAFQSSIKRAKIDSDNKKIHFTDYLSEEEINTHLTKKRGRPKVIVLDNLTVYDEIKSKSIKKYLYDYPNTIVIMVAHEERNQPVPASAKMAKKLASVIMRSQGLQLHVWGRVPGGVLNINEEKAQLYHGN